MPQLAGLQLAGLQGPLSVEAQPTFTPSLAPAAPSCACFAQAAVASLVPFTSSLRVWGVRAVCVLKALS